MTYPDDAQDDRGYVELCYDAALRLTRKTDQERQDTILDYDSMRRVLTRTAGGQIDHFGYTALGQLAVAERGVSGNLDSVAKSERSYDGLGRLTREAQTIGEGATRNVDYAYDKNGNALTITYPGGEKIETTYDAASRRDVIKRDGSQLADYAYVGARVARLIYETGANDVTATRLYDGAARMTRLTWARAASTLPDFSYDLDAVGNILTKTHEHRASNKAEAYALDGLYRLTEARYDYRTLTHEFTYDDLGNQLNFGENGSDTAYLHNEVNEITKAGGTEVLHDKNGNLTRDTSDYVYYYNRENKLTKVTEDDGGETDVATYAYDALGRRIEFIDRVNSITKRYYLDGDRVIEEYDATGTPARQRYYVWGNYIDELLVLNSDKDDGDPDYFGCHNQLFSPEALVDSSGAIVERYDYDAYGQPVIYTDAGDDGWWSDDEQTATASAKGLVYLFTGREYDSLDDGALPVQYSRARSYSFSYRRWLQRDPGAGAGSPARVGTAGPVVGGGFIQRDPVARVSPGIGQAGLSNQYADGMNLYQYLQSKPVGSADPMGLATQNFTIHGHNGWYRFRGKWVWSCVAGKESSKVDDNPGLTGWTAVGGGNTNISGGGISIGVGVWASYSTSNNSVWEDCTTDDGCTGRRYKVDLHTYVFKNLGLLITYKVQVGHRNFRRLCPCRKVA